MGGICSRTTVVEGIKDRDTELIDRMIEEEKTRDQLHFKILILGAGESGKSTIVKQLTFIHKHSFSRDEKLSYVKVLQNNTIQCMVTLVKEAEAFGYTFNSHERQAADAILSHDQRNPMPPDMCEDIELLWNCPAVQKSYERRNEFWHLEATEYYFNNAMRFVEEGYIPTDEDIVMARKRTTGVYSLSFAYGNVDWTIVDVGGQRSERRKWLSCFEGVKAIIYVCNLAGYCKVLFEDKAVNRMHESLNLFEATMSNPMFASTPVFLFLNKKDLFEELLRQQNIDCCFPEYSGPNELRPCIEYISEQFQKRLPPKHSRALVLLLAARMKKDVQYCFEETKDILLDMHKKGIEKAMKQLERVERRNKEDFYRDRDEPSPEPEILIKDASNGNAVIGNGNPNGQQYTNGANSSSHTNMVTKGKQEDQRKNEKEREKPHLPQQQQQEQNGNTPAGHETETATTKGQETNQNGNETAAAAATTAGTAAS